jgi:DNA mismatch repair protein MutS2
VPAVRTRNNTLDLRGARVEDAAPRVEAFADQLLREGEAVGFVLHGHGTGALKTTVRQLLRTARYVERAAEADADQGGDAFTMFWLR